MSDQVARMMFDGLVRRAGGVDAVAAILEARHGCGHKGTVSKMCAGQIGLTLAAVVAVEDALGAFPITERLHARVADEGAAQGNLPELAARISSSGGDAVAVLLRALGSAGDGGCRVTRAEAADIVAQLRALAEVVAAAIATAESIAAEGRA